MIHDAVERTEISFSCQQLKHKFLLMQPTAQSLISLSYSTSLSCKLCYPIHSTVPAVKQAVAIWVLPDLMVPQGVQGTNNFLNTNAMRQTPSYTSEYFLIQSKNSPILQDLTGSSECLFQFADTDLVICIVYSVSNGRLSSQATGYKPFSGFFIYLSVCLSIFALVGPHFFCYMECIHRLTWKCTILK
jgi:hypothetical protein